MKTTPNTMKAVQCKDYGAIREVMSVEDSVPVPNLEDEYTPVEKIHPLIRFATKEDRKTHMIIKTLAVALAPGDCRVLSGRTRKFQGPPSFPYVPGGDVCGIVTETLPTETYFKPGDLVAARFSNTPRDALGEYARVSSTVCEKLDPGKGISPEEAAALASASSAVILGDHIRPKERVLILGAGGGIGSHVVQLARLKGASFVCGVSRDPQRLLEAPLCYDRAIDYTKENVFDCQEFQDEPFDTIIDLACGGWLQLEDSSRKNVPAIVKPASEGGRFIALTSDTPTFDADRLGTLLYLFMFKPLWRSLWSRIFTRRRLPTFLNPNGLPNDREIISRTLNLAYEKKLRAVVDGPYSMTTEGVQKAFQIQESRHGKGKVVIKVAEFLGES